MVSLMAKSGILVGEEYGLRDARDPDAPLQHRECAHCQPAGIIWPVQALARGVR
jgi:hypothetical protein